MYGYDYENEILLLMRVLKYLFQSDQNSFHILLSGGKELDCDDLYDTAESLFDCIFVNAEIDFDTESQLDVIYLSHPSLDKVLSLSREWCSLSATSIGARRKQLEDIMDFFLVGAGYIIYDIKYRFTNNSVQITLWMSPEWYEPLLLLNYLVSLLLYVQEENEHLERLIWEKKQEGAMDEENRLKKEAT